MPATLSGNAKTVAEFFARQYSGDFDRAFELATEDFNWIVSSRDNEELTAAIPWAGVRFVGKAGYEKLMSELFGEFDAEVFEPRHYTDGGDRVLVEGYFRFRHKVTGRIADSDWLARFDIRDGRISGGQFFENTYAVARARRSS